MAMDGPARSVTEETFSRDRIEHLVLSGLPGIEDQAMRVATGQTPPKPEWGTLPESAAFRSAACLFQPVLADARAAAEQEVRALRTIEGYVPRDPFSDAFETCCADQLAIVVRVIRSKLKAALAELMAEQDLALLAHLEHRRLRRLLQELFAKGRSDFHLECQAALRPCAASPAIEAAPSEGQVSGAGGRRSRWGRGGQSKADAFELWLAALSQHHEYEDGAIGNHQPIAVRQLAKHAGIGRDMCSRLFKEYFKHRDQRGHKVYAAECRRDRLGGRLARLRGEGLPEGVELQEALHAAV